MTPHRALAIGVATLIWAISLWFGFLSLSGDRTIALVIIALGLVFSLYALAALSGAADLASTGFRASLSGLGTAIALLIASQVTGVDSFAIAAPLAAAGVGGSTALQPEPDSIGGGVRIGTTIAISLAFVWLFGIDRTVYGLMAPLVALPGLAVADRVLVRVRGVVAESASD